MKKLPRDEEAPPEAPAIDAIFDVYLRGRSAVEILKSLSEIIHPQKELRLPFDELSHLKFRKCLHGLQLVILEKKESVKQRLNRNELDRSRRRHI